ncbi:unnamed protein product, partial [Ectocarpus fasciculatus]
HTRRGRRSTTAVPGLRTVWRPLPLHCCRGAAWQPPSFCAHDVCGCCVKLGRTICYDILPLNLADGPLKLAPICMCVCVLLTPH